MKDHPLLTILGALAAIATILTFVFTIVIDGGGTVGMDNLGGPCDDPQLSLSDGSGPSGTEVVVRGSGFPGREDVDLRFHTESLTPARTDDGGNFEVNVRIPGSFDPFAPQQFDIVASADACSDNIAFQLQP